MKRIFLRLKQPLRNERGEITFFACFFVVGIVMLISFLLLYASIRITCINIRNGAKMELNNLSGDGAGVSARLFKRYGAQIWGGLHLKMPDCICDVKALKRTPDQNKQIVIQAEECIKSAVYNLKNGTPTKNGLGFWCHIAGLLGQRLWFYRKTQAYSDKIQINSDTCIKCGKCALVCPMNNLSLSKGKIVANGRCTLCYRCVNQCSKKSITILGKKVMSQYSIYDFGD